MTMKPVHSLVIVPLLLRSFSCDVPKIAIIGSGIGGSSTSYFIREYLGNTVQIDQYEKNKIGGRLATVEYDGNSFETGGSIIHERNKYMNEYRKKFLLKKRISDGNDCVGIRNKDGFEFFTSNWKILTYLKMLFRYGYSLFRLDSFIDKMLDEFDNIYKYQEQGKSYFTVEELFAEACPLFSSYFNVSSKLGFSKLAHLNDRVINELVEGSLRVNYGQTTSVPLFVGSVSMAGMFGTLYAIDGGNKQIPELLIQNSSVQFVNRLVTRIEYDKERKEYLVESVDSSTHQKSSISYSVVVIATPITSDSVTPIKFVNFEKPITVHGRYHRTVATLVSGNLNASYYDLPKGSAVPDLIINNNAKDVINSIGTIQPVTGAKTTKNKVWKIFSQRPLEKSELEKLFDEYNVIKVDDWLAYPEYKLLKLSGEFVLHDKLYYVNAIEWAASAMEMSVIGAKNVALLVRDAIKGCKIKGKEIKVNFKKVEL